MLRMRKFHRLEVICRANRKEGLRGFVSTAFRVLRSQLLGQRRLIFGLVPSDLKLKPPIKIPGYEVVSITSSNVIDNVLRDKFTQYSRYIWWDTDTMLTKGACLWVGYLNGEFANITWTRTGDKIRSYFFPMTPECVLVSHSVTIPEYRGRGLYPAILTEVIRALADQGFKRFYIDCTDWNQSSSRVIERIGFSLMGRGKCKRKGRLAWYQESPPDFTQINNEGQLI